MRLTEALLDFVKPFADAADGMEEREWLLMMGISAWNIALLPLHHRERMVNRTALAAVAGGSRLRGLLCRVKTAVFGESTPLAALRRLLQDMIERKLQYYAEDGRFVVDYHFSDAGDDLHLSVVFTRKGE